jgi:hypothetical protein
LKCEKHQFEILDVPREIEVKVHSPIFVQEGFIEFAHLVSWYAIFARLLTFLYELIPLGKETLIVMSPKFIDPNVDFLAA